MRLLSIPMLSKKTVLVLPPTSVLLASLSAQGSHVNGLYFYHMRTPFFHIPQALIQGQDLAKSTVLSCVLS